MKFNPYAVLLTTGALMLATVLFAQRGSSIALLKGCRWQMALSSRPRSR